VSGESESPASLPDLTGIILIRSLTKTWGLAGLRAGYVLAVPDMIEQLNSGQPLARFCSRAHSLRRHRDTAALREAYAWAVTPARERAYLLVHLGIADNIRVVPGPSASSVLFDTGIADVCARLHAHGFAVRRGETFPGLVRGGSGWRCGTWRRRAGSPAHCGRSPAMRDQAKARTGCVVLVGGGPGADYLITIRGLDRLTAADVVISDRLAPVGLLTRLGPQVEIVDAARLPGRPTLIQRALSASPWYLATCIPTG
jgi:hypothetical protein